MKLRLQIDIDIDPHGSSEKEIYSHLYEHTRLLFSELIKDKPLGDTSALVDKCDATVVALDENYVKEELPPKEKLSPHSSELMKTLQNEICSNRNDWQFGGQTVVDAGAFGSESQLIVTLSDGKKIILRALDYPDVRHPQYYSPNGSTCGDGCPGWGIFYRDEKGTHEIQKCDMCDKFDSDDEALAYVQMLESMDVGKEIAEVGISPHEWLKNDKLFIQMLAAVYNHYYTSNGHLIVDMEKLQAFMDKGWNEVLEIFTRADAVWTYTKTRR